MPNEKATPTGAGRFRGDRRLQEMDHDPYHAKQKLPEPTICPSCGAIFTAGRWSWGDPPDGAHQTRCPACQRIHDRVPAAFLTLSGAFREAHDAEIRNLMHNYEQRERSEHPLKRIMDIEKHNGELVVTFTDPHLARGIGEALYNAYEGELDYQYTKGDNMLRVTWRR